jgi:hypothetical protein
MAKAKQQEKRAQIRPLTTPRTPEPKEEIPVIGSSCTWGKSELDHFNVKMERNMNVREVIPEKFFDFERLEFYRKCRILSFGVLIVGKDNICTISPDMMEKKIVNRITNSSKIVFTSFLDILSLQPALRGANISNKRRNTEQRETSRMRVAGNIRSHIH